MPHRKVTVEYTVLADSDEEALRLVNENVLLDYHTAPAHRFISVHTHEKVEHVSEDFKVVVSDLEVQVPDTSLVEALAKHQDVMAMLRGIFVDDQYGGLVSLVSEETGMIETQYRITPDNEHLPDPSPMPGFDSYIVVLYDTKTDSTVIGAVSEQKSYADDEVCSRIRWRGRPAADFQFVACIPWARLSMLQEVS